MVLGHRVKLGRLYMKSGSFFKHHQEISNLDPVFNYFTACVVNFLHHYPSNSIIRGQDAYSPLFAYCGRREWSLKDFFIYHFLCVATSEMERNLTQSWYSPNTGYLHWTVGCVSLLTSEIIFFLLNIDKASMERRLTRGDLILIIRMIQGRLDDRFYAPIKQFNLRHDFQQRQYRSRPTFYTTPLEIS